MAKIRLDTVTNDAALKRLNKELAKSDKELEEISKTARGAARQAQKFAELADPTKKLNREYATLARQVKAGRVSMEDAQVVAGKYQNRLDRISGSHKNAFGQTAVASIAGMATSFFSLSAIASAYLGTLSSIQEKQKAIAAAQVAGLAPRAKLVQLAGGSVAKRKSLFSASDKTFAEGFVPSREASDALTFELDSADRLADRQFFSRMALVDDSAALARSAGLIASGFEGGDKVGTSQDIVSKVIAGALPATGVSPADIAEGAATTAASAKGFGFSDEETIAAVSRIAQQTGSGSEAGTRLRRLLSALTRQGLADKMQGQSLSSVVSHVGGMGMSKAELTKYLGSVEAVQAYDILSNEAAFATRLQEVETAQQTGLAQQTVRNALQDDVIRGGVMARVGRARNALSQEQQGVAQNRQEWFEQTVQGEMRAQGASEANIDWWAWGEQTRAYYSGPRDFEKTHGMTADDEIKMLLQEGNDIMRGATQQIGRQE